MAIAQIDRKAPAEVISIALSEFQNYAMQLLLVQICAICQIVRIKKLNVEQLRFFNTQSNDHQSRGLNRGSEKVRSCNAKSLKKLRSDYIKTLSEEQKKHENLAVDRWSDTKVAV